MKIWQWSIGCASFPIICWIIGFIFTGKIMEWWFILPLSIMMGLQPFLIVIGEAWAIKRIYKCSWKKAFKIQQKEA